MTYRETLLHYKKIIDTGLDEYTRFPPKRQERLFDAMRYSLMAGGKRIRPILTLEFARLCGGAENAAIPAACSIEMMHTFSLIHDDLPCMDNDDMRRGRKSCHRQFDESTALLAGDALEMYPFQILTDSVSHGVSAENTIKMIRLLSEYAGHIGMIGGQQIDIQFEGECSEEKELTEMYRLKTSRLLQAAACMGCLSAGAGEDKIGIAFEYGDKLGLAFQITDDVLDVCGDSQELGKPVGSDVENNKKTFVSLLGIEAAKERAKQLTQQALDLAEGFTDCGFLKELTLELLNRNK